MCREGDVVALNTLLETNQPNLDHSNAKGLSALHYAARNNHAEVIQLLINHGAGRDIHLYSLISVNCMVVGTTDESKLLAPVVQKVDNGIAQLVSLILIHWIEIYPVDSAIQLLNNWGQVKSV